MIYELPDALQKIIGLTDSDAAKITLQARSSMTNWQKH
jgi:hypothetical protein